MTEFYCYNLEIYELEAGQSRKVFCHSFNPKEMYKVMEAIKSYSYREWYGDILLKLESNTRRLVEHELNLKQMVENYQANLIQLALVKTGGNKLQAAKLLKVNRTTLVELTKRYGLNDVGKDSPTCAGYTLHVVDNLEERLKQQDIESMSEGEIEHMIERTKLIQATAQAKLREVKRSSESKEVPKLRLVNES